MRTHGLRRRQDSRAVERAGLRLLKQQAKAGDIVRLFADEAEALPHPYLAHARARRGEDLRIPAPGRAERRAIFGVRDSGRRRLLVRSGPTERGEDFVRLPEAVEREYGPRPAARPARSAW